MEINDVKARVSEMLIFMAHTDVSEEERAFSTDMRFSSYCVGVIKLYIFYSIIGNYSSINIIKIVSRSVS